MSDYLQTPILRFELQGFKQSITHAFMHHADEVNVMINNAVTAYCTPETLELEIRSQAKACINEAIKEEIRAFYVYGEGRQVVRAAVLRQLDDQNDDNHREETAG